MPHTPGMSVVSSVFRATVMSQVDVPRIFTSVPEATPEPTAP